MRATEQTVKVEITIDASQATVFRCVTRGELLAKWLEASVDFDASLGGKMRIAFNGCSEVVEGEVTEFDPHDLIAFTWGVSEGSSKAEMPVGSTAVRIALTPSGNGTHLVLTHSGLPANQVHDHQVGWQEYAEALASLAARVHE